MAKKEKEISVEGVTVRLRKVQNAHGEDFTRLEVAVHVGHYLYDFTGKAFDDGKRLTPSDFMVLAVRKEGDK